MNNKKSSLSGLLAVIGFILMISLFFQYSSNKRKDEIKKFDKNTVAYITRIKKEGKTSSLMLYFYFNGKKYVVRESSKGMDKSDLRKYYKIDFESKNPENNSVYLKSSIDPDSITLTKAGFKYVQYSEYDYRTGDYIIKYKWQ